MEKKEFKLFKDLFIHDEEICEYFKSIISSESKKNSVPLDELKKLEDENDKLKASISKIESEKKRLSESFSSYKANYDCLDNIYALYEKLSSETKERLLNVFSGKTSLEFFAGAVQIENILTLWDFIKRRIIENENNDVVGLSEIFKFLLTMYNNGKEKEEYAFISPEIGESFDSDKHYIVDEKTDGNISEVLLVGMYNKKTKKTFKALVKVK